MYRTKKISETFQPAINLSREQREECEKFRYVKKFRGKIKFAVGIRIVIFEVQFYRIIFHVMLFFVIDIAVIIELFLFEYYIYNLHLIYVLFNSLTKNGDLGWTLRSYEEKERLSMTFDGGANLALKSASMFASSSRQP